MASMDHPYVVRLFGISMGRQMMLVSQFVPLGSLLEFLRKHKERLNAKNMLTFAHQIAEVRTSGLMEPSTDFLCALSIVQFWPLSSLSGHGLLGAATHGAP